MNLRYKVVWKDGQPGIVGGQIEPRISQAGKVYRRVHWRDGTWGQPGAGQKTIVEAIFESAIAACRCGCHQWGSGADPWTASTRLNRLGRLTEKLRRVGLYR